MPGTMRQAKEIFLDAIELTDPQRRQDFLAKECSDNAALRAEVQELLQHYNALGGFFATGPMTPASTKEDDSTETAGTIIGPYKLLQKIGEGGMGIVFMAEQTRPVQRKVALKVIKPGMDSKQVIARFEAERQALAMMDHVNIARVFDGGTTESGRPYFVMELVHGIPITKYCDDNHLTPRERLELFIPVCQAIQHAHQKGVIHRDIKPSNVLVTLYDGKPVAKVIDFGVAKATEQKLTDRTMFTNFGMMVGTLEYMSPEQAEMSALGVDTRSDIYSLGVLLYELLTGSTPISRQQMKLAAYAEVLRMIKDEEPPRPSTRLSTSGAALETISAQRKTEPTKLTKLVRGELDWIVMKTLEKDRNRRYESPSALARDIQNYLADESVEACPPSVGYRLRKFVRRNKGPVLAAAAIILALLGGIIGTTLGLFEASRQRDGALAAAEAEKKAKETAEQRETETTAVLDFVENKIFAAARPKDQEGGLGYDVKLADAIKTALTFVDKSFPNQPLIEARLRMTLGKSYWYLGDNKAAAEQYEAARTLYTQHLGPEHPDTLGSMHYLAHSYAELSRYAEALALAEKTLALRKAKLGLSHIDTFRTMQSVASRYNELGRYNDALKLNEETLALKKAKLGPDHPDTQNSMNNLAVSYDHFHRYDDALKLREETLALRKAKLGSNHPLTLVSMMNLALSYNIAGMHVDAFKLYQETLTLQKANLPRGHINTLATMHNLANCYSDLGQLDEAINLNEEALELMKEHLGQDHSRTLMSMLNLATHYSARGQHDKAIKLQEEVLAIQKAKLPPDHPDTLQSMSNLGCYYGRLGRWADAIKLSEETLKLRKAKLGPDDPNTLVTMNNLIEALANCPDVKFRDPRRAVELAKDAIELAPKNRDSWNNLGVVRYRIGEWQAAVNALKKSMQLRKGGDSSDWFFLAMANWRLGQKPEARKWCEQAVQWMEKNKPQDKELNQFRAEALELMKETSTTQK